MDEFYQLSTPRFVATILVGDQRPEFTLACPFFYPTERHESELWPFRRRLPLGDGFLGRCTAPGQDGTEPEPPVLRDCCNLGYAQCSRLPKDRQADAVHFSVAADRDGVVSLHWVLVKNHAAESFGQLHFQRAAGTWQVEHSNPTLQRMAQCYLDSYLCKRGELRAALASR